LANQATRELAKAAVKLYVEKAISAGLGGVAKDAFELYSNAKTGSDYAKWYNQLQKDMPEIEAKMKKALGMPPDR